MAKQKFRTEVSQLLHLIVHSLYSNKEIFLRELISNASDAMDKLRYLTLSDSKYKSMEFSPKIDIEFEDKEKSLTITDNGIGMNKEDLIENLGTIARSGTKKFIETLSGDSKKDSNLIGQFGVGFYSCFMVADKVEVTTKKAGEKVAYLWKSDGKTGFTIKEVEKESCGTTIKLFLNDEGKEYTNKWSIETIVKKYSDHIAFPIYLHYTETKEDKKTEDVIDQVNSASAFWKRNKSSLKKKDYNEFYKTFANDNEDPMFHVHTTAEGTLDYTTLFYVPKVAPFDMFNADYKPGVKLYVKRVFITDDDKELMPVYLRFLRGVIDTEDLPLNVSREILQKNKILDKIKRNSVKKVLKAIDNLAKKDQNKYNEFYKQYGIALKEGLYQDFENRELLLELVRFRTNKNENYISLSDYVSNMSKDQKSIFYIVGESYGSIKASPLLETCNKKGIEVLIMDNEIDEFVFSSVTKYKDYTFKSINHSDAMEEIQTDDDKKDSDACKPLIKKMKAVLGDKVKDVIVSQRLTDSPSCIVADSNDPSAQMQKMFQQMGQMNMPEAKPILEINPKHKIVKKMNKMSKTKQFTDSVFLVYEQAMLAENMKLDNPIEFVNRMNRALEKAL
ncbi:MAG: molecular chaperone HtpG [Candidatus Marinimicrobia bacterium]|nr:molecular chaperone HtpG [Candidatus Neomarinimicrobiota bacterium]|tara:strand:+ start:18191 stop:20041 length:1851 start_codon:yes stop_codon:yes gene_type:complete